MRTHMAKTAHLPAEYIPPTFSTRTPSPYSAGWRWGLLSRKIFSDFYFSDFARNPQMFGLRIFWILHSLFLSRNFFLFFSWLRSYLDLYSILQNICRFNSLQVFARYSSSASFYIHHVWISRFQTLNFNSFLLVEFWLASISTCFSIIDYTLWLFISSACYKQTSMLMQSLVYACFSYFKAFWRVFVCFRCSLSSWVKIMRQKA